MSKDVVMIFNGMFTSEQNYQWIPWGLYFLSAKIKEMGLQPVIVEEFTERANYQEIIRKYADRTLLFGVSAMSGRQITSGLGASKFFRECSPDTPIAWGGAHATALPLETIKDEYVDYVFVGQAVETLPQLLTFLKEGIEVKDIPCVIRKCEAAITQPSRLDFNEFPQFPFDMMKIPEILNPRTMVINYTASVGCPGSCSFCSWGGPHRWVSFPIERVLDDIGYLVSKYNLTTVWLSDADFLYKPDYALQFAQGLLDRNIDIWWRCNGRLSDLIKFSRNDFALLEQSGLDVIFIGVESVVPRIMKMMKKIIRPEHITELAELLKDSNIQLYLSFIEGVPTETLEEAQQAYKWISVWQKIDPKIVYQVCVYVPYPGTPMTELAAQNGFKLPETLYEWGNHPIFNEDRAVGSYREWFSGEFNQKFFGVINKLYHTTPSLFKPPGSKNPKRNRVVY